MALANASEFCVSVGRVKFKFSVQEESLKPHCSTGLTRVPISNDCPDACLTRWEALSIKLSIW
jgi:hypothetical protein